MTLAFNEALDLSFEREVPVTPDFLWRGWTEPALLVQWFTPAPWVTTEAEVDPMPGGIFRTVMEGPNGERQEGASCILVAEPGRRLVWTNALGPGFRPQVAAEGDFVFTAYLDFEALPSGSRYRATVRHASEADARTHAEMGFETGWGAALDQLVGLG